MQISITEVKLFKACRRAWWLRYREGLVPKATAESLVIGRTYHEKLESLYKTGAFDADDLSRESAMATAYMKYIYPSFDVIETEKWFEYVLNSLPGHVSLIGRVDGESTGALVEHKTTSTEITEEYEYNLQWDEQLLAYMMATGYRKAWYTICRKPTIRQRKDESDEQYFERMVTWYDEDTERKIRLLQIERTDREICEFERELCNIADEMRVAWIYRNPGSCMSYGRRCEYAPVCLNYDPDRDYIEFDRRPIHED